MLKPKLRKLADKIYCLEFKNAYDLSMTFLRCQEYYESPKFKNKFFTLSDFMEWYSKKFGEGSFTYPVDYVGFNLPSRVIVSVIYKLKIDKYDVWTPYDQLMYDTIGTIVKELPNGGESFYLIGIVKDPSDKTTLPHELAHALFTTNNEYQRTMGRLINALPEKIWRSMKRKLKARGYASNVYDDETQAYLATGLHQSMKNKGTRKAAKPFQKFFKPYAKNIL